MNTTLKCALRALLFGILASLSFAGEAQTQRMPRGSYLAKPVGSADDIVRQLKTTPKLMERYTRLFNLPPEQVRAAMGELRLTKLRTDRVFKVYYVRHGEVLGYRLRTVKAGTPIFVLPDGTPALVQACGNPLRTDLSGAAVKNTKPLELDGTPDPSQPLETLPAPADETTVTRSAASLSNEAPMAAPDSTLAALPGEDVSDFVPDLGALPLGSVVHGGSSLLSSGGLIAAGLAGLGTWIAGGGTSGGGGSNTPGGGNPGGGNPGGGNPGVSLTPEWNSGTLFLFALGGLWLGRRWRQRREIRA